MKRFMPGETLMMAKWSVIGARRDGIDNGVLIQSAAFISLIELSQSMHRICGYSLESIISAHQAYHRALWW